jgi:hypothetical protein
MLPPSTSKSWVRKSSKAQPPERHGPNLAEDLGDILEVHVAGIQDGSEMVVEHLIEAFAPFFPGKELHQTFEVMAGRH